MGHLSFSAAEVNGVHKAVFGRAARIQALYAGRTEFRSVVRFLGPSKFSSPEYRSAVQGILDEIKAELLAYRSQVEIQNGVSLLGLDAMLSETFLGHLPTSGVVGWPLPKVTLTLQDDTKIVYTEGRPWSQGLYETKMREVALRFRGLALLMEGKMPEEGVEIIQPSLTIDGQSVKRMVVSPDGTGFTPVDRFVIYGTDWSTAYEMYRPGLVATVVLGGGPISFAEAITAQTLGLPVLCISPDILPNEHKPGVPSASVRLVKDNGLTPLDPQGISRAVIQAVEAQNNYSSLL